MYRMYKIGKGYQNELIERLGIGEDVNERSPVTSLRRCRRSSTKPTICQKSALYTRTVRMGASLLSSIPPEVLETIRRKLRVAHSVLDVLVAEVVL